MKKLIITIIMTIGTLLTLTTPAYAASSAEATPKSETYVVTGTYVNIRSGPGTAYKKLGKLDRGMTETGVVTNGWLKFSYNDSDAYCSAAYLTVYTGPADEASSVGTSTAGTAQTLTYQVTATELRIRSGPGTTYTVLGKLPKGSQETGVITGGWLKFTYNNEEAYCSAAYLVPVSSTAN